jgi:formylglycine-generating enzyme required for sulfatase activity
MSNVATIHMTPSSRDFNHPPEMVTISQGAFLMGGIAEDKFVSAVEMPQHEVVFEKPFSVARAPVTRRQWLALMGSLPFGEPGGLDPDCPVTHVTFPEVMAYLRELSITFGKVYRLPSEAEWEYACRAGSSSVFSNSNQIDVSDANFLYDEHGVEIGVGQTTPVGRYPANAHGIVDLLGNVCEWTADVWHPNYQNAPSDGSAWTHGGKSAFRAIRGGAWDHLPRVLRASWRDWAPEQARWDNLGFRVALTH